MKENEMLKNRTTHQRKTQKMVNPRTGEEWWCDDITKTKVIDGTTFLEVYREGKPQRYFINKEALEKFR